MFPGVSRPYELTVVVVATAEVLVIELAVTELILVFLREYFAVAFVVLTLNEWLILGIDMARHQGVILCQRRLVTGLVCQLESQFPVGLNLRSHRHF